MDKSIICPKCGQKIHVDKNNKNEPHTVATKRGARLCNEAKR